MKYTLNDFPGASYTFDKDTGTVTLIGLSISLERSNMYAILNITNPGPIMKIGTDGFGITSIEDNVLTLQFDTTSMNNTDELAFVFDLEERPVSLSDNSIQTMLSNIESIITTTNRYLSYFQTLTNKDSSGRQNVNVNTGSIAISGTANVAVASGTLGALTNLTNVGGQDGKTMQNNLAFIAYALNRVKNIVYS